MVLSVLKLNIKLHDGRGGGGKCILLHYSQKKESLSHTFYFMQNGAIYFYFEHFLHMLLKSLWIVFFGCLLLVFSFAKQYDISL